MAVSELMVAQVSPFEVGTDFGQADFDQYKEWAKEELDKRDPGLPTGKYDEAWANLICDCHISSKGNQDKKSEHIDTYSYTKDASGKSSYRLQFERILKQWSGEHPTEGVERGDVDDMPTQFSLDRQPVRRFGGDE